MQELKTIRYQFSYPEKVGAIYYPCSFDGKHFMVLNCTIFHCPITFRSINQPETPEPPRNPRKIRSKSFRYEERKLLIELCMEFITTAMADLKSMVDTMQTQYPDYEPLKQVFAAKHTRCRVSTKAKHLLLCKPQNRLKSVRK
jgi:hypothetical protein